MPFEMNRAARRQSLTFALGAALLAGAMLSGAPAAAAGVGDQQWAGLTGRLFPALSALEAAGARKSVAAASVLQERRKRMDACNHVVSCLLRTAIWSDAEMAQVAALATDALDAPTRRRIGADDGAPAQVVRELKGLNGIIQVYGLRTVPRYPQIDGPIDPPGSAQFNATLADAMMLAEAGFDDPAAALDPSLALAAALLDVNNARDAIAFEPLGQAHNAGALALAPSVEWKRYRYSAILVPGVGPTDLSNPLSARGKLNVRMAAARFAERLAPFIIVSGSGVHPRGTPFVEAVEMRRALVERYGVPAERILIEPYARHTTTNLRNATRLLIGLGAPLDREVLVTSNAEHVAYIAGPDFQARGVLELGYGTGTVTGRPSPTEVTFRPVTASGRVDPADPLDP